jgi:hypothetical protein
VPFIKCNDSSMTTYPAPCSDLTCKSEFHKAFPISPVPDKLTLCWRSISVPGSTKNSKHSGKHLVLSNGNVENIHQILLHSPKKSLTDLSHQSRSSYGSVQRLHTAHKANSTLLMISNFCGDHITSHKL